MYRLSVGRLSKVVFTKLTPTMFKELQKIIEMVDNKVELMEPTTTFITRVGQGVLKINQQEC
jgi:uncharacterized protein YoxC